MKSIQPPPVGFSRALELTGELKLVYPVCRLMWCMYETEMACNMQDQRDQLQLDS